MIFLSKEQEVEVLTLQHIQTSNTDMYITVLLFTTHRTLAVLFHSFVCVSERPNRPPRRAASRARSLEHDRDVGALRVEPPRPHVAVDRRPAEGRAEDGRVGEQARDAVHLAPVAAAVALQQRRGALEARVVLWGGME